VKPTDDPRVQSKRRDDSPTPAEPATVPADVKAAARLLSEAEPAAGRAHAKAAARPLAEPLTPAPRPMRASRNGIGAVLLIDALALLFVLGSGPAAYIWLDRSHPSPLAAASQDTGATPTPGGSAEPGGSTTPGASSSVSATPSPKLVYGDGTWIRIDSLPAASWAAASVRLHDGRVMVAGGTSGASSNNAIARASIFDPATGHWTAVTDMLQPRTYPMAVTLADGSVLVAGGSRNGQPLDTAERYYPKAGTWVAAGRLNLPRTRGALTLLPDGRVLATGGGIEGTPGWATTASAEVFDPKRGVWSIVAPMSVARGQHSAVLLPDGEVLVFGGATTYFGETGDVTARAEIFNPASNSWRPAAPMSKPRYAHSAALLTDGRVLVAGGWYATSNSDRSHETAEIYDPVADRWTATGSMTKPRAEYGLVSLPDGRVLAAGGVDVVFKVMPGSELYDPTTGVWMSMGNLGVGRMFLAIETLPDGRVLVAGGELDGGKPTAVCEIYTPPPR
jgi:N-acetylneuraminic acid mutarotase